jgi:hypothetical protein
MKLDPKKIKEDENNSNPMVVAFSTEECPLSEKRPCFFIFVGPGTMHEPCSHFKDNCTVEVADIECTAEEDLKSMMAP